VLLRARRGQIQLPSQISEAVARKQIKVVRQALAFADVAFSVDDPDEIFAQTNVLFGGLKNAMIVDPDATATAMREAVRGGSREQLQALVLRHAAIADG
jgi:hypothetical protein